MWLYDPMRGYLKEFRTKDVEKILGKDTVYVCRHSKSEDYNKEIKKQKIFSCLLKERNF